MATLSGSPSAVRAEDRSPGDVWFRRRPRLAVLVAGAMFAGILLERLLLGDPSDAPSLLLVFPVTLLAATFGTRVGAAAGGFAVLLIAVWVVAKDVPLSPLGWISRTLPLLLLGFLVGRATERISRAESERRSHEAAALLHRKAIEVNDTLVQGMAAARWSLDSGRQEDGLRALDETIAQGHQLVSELLREGRMGDRSGPASPA